MYMSIKFFRDFMEKFESYRKSKEDIYDTHTRARNLFGITIYVNILH